MWGYYITMICLTMISSVLSNSNITSANNSRFKVAGEKLYHTTITQQGKSEKETIRKEDPSEVEEFLLNDGPFVYENPSVYPPNRYPSEYPGQYPSEYPGRYNPNYPGTNFIPGGVGGDVDAFTARKAADIELLPGRKILFLDTVTELGRGWKRSISEFVCELPGVFFFTFSACGERYRHFRITLKHNGVGVVSAYGDANGYQMASNSAVLRLLAGDRVYLQLDEGGIYEVTTVSGRAYNTFSGFRIL